MSESQLMQLFSICPSCTSATLCQVRPVSGTMIKIDQCCCICGFRRSWNSQEMIGSIPSGNLFMSAAILFSGMLYSFISLHNCYNHKLIMNVLKMSALLFFYTDRPYTKESASFLGAYECCYYSIKYLPPTSEILSSSSCFNNVERFSE